jgi:hypothetical protein
MPLEDLVAQVNSFDAMLPGERIRLFAWWLHTHRGMTTFKTGDIRGCFDMMHLPVPNIAMYLTRMTETRPAKALRKGDSYNLAREARTDLDKKFGVHHSVVAVSKILTDLPAQVPNINERAFLQEALKCYRHEAYRACIVMVWNLAYSHLLDWILADATRLDAFNGAIIKIYPKKKGLTIAKYEDFTEELTEREVVEIANVADVYTSVVFRILKQKLDRRNIVAHPSNVVVVQSQADDMITDLVHNVVLAFT